MPQPDFAFMVSGAALLVAGFRFAPRMKNPVSARWCAAGAFFAGGLLLQLGHMWQVLAEGKYYRTLSFLAPVIIGLAPGLLLPGAVERLRSRASGGEPPAPPEGRRIGPVVLAGLWALAWTTAGIAQLVYMLTDVTPLIEIYERTLSLIDLTPPEK
jgi:hypothetical protein